MSPLLLELARALRARRYYAGADPALIEILDRAGAVWSATLARSPALRLDVHADGFALASGERVLGTAVAQLAADLAHAGIEQLEFRPRLRAEELSALVEILAAVGTDSSPAHTDYPAAFAQAGIANISLGYALLAPRPAAAASAARKPEPAAPAPAPVPAPPPAPRERGRRETDYDRIGACLADLDRGNDAVEYQRGLEKLRTQLEPRMRSGDYVDAYAAALMLGRHTGSRERSTAICEAASEALQSLVLSEPALTRLALERVYSPSSSGAAIEALQLLANLGPRLVPHLLAAHERGGPDAKQCTAAILLAMGDPVFPALVEQIDSTASGRAVLACDLLGEMQNPRALPSLSSALASRRPLPLRLAAARAVARVGGDRARVVLEAHCESPTEEIARACQAALAQWKAARR